MKKIGMILAMGLALLAALGAIGITEDTIISDVSLVDEWEYSGIRSLKIEEASVFAVQVTGGSGRRLEAKIYGPSKRDVEVHHEKRGGELLVWVEWKTKRISWHGVSPRMVFQVPYEIDLDIETSTGSLTVEGCEGEKGIYTSTGSITVTDSNGDIRAVSSTGSHEYEDVTGDMRIESSTGSQRYRDTQGFIQAESTTGGITISRHRGALDLRSSTGSQEGEDILLTGDSSFHTSTGSIDFDFRNALESFSFDLRSSTGRIRVGDTDARGQLRFGNGSIEITATSSTGSQSYR